MNHDLMHGTLEPLQQHPERDDYDPTGTLSFC
jgi:hypothetical protein